MAVPLRGVKARGRVALVDDEDYDLVMQYRWVVWERVTHTGYLNGPYAQATVTPGPSSKPRSHTSIRMHKLITDWPLTDHVNHDGLDNRRENLREATKAQNNRYRRPRAGGSSRFKGVTRERRSGRWVAQIRLNGVRVYIGTYEDEAEAARSYDARARELFGEFAYPNFPELAAGAR